LVFYKQRCKKAISLLPVVLFMTFCGGLYLGFAKSLNEGFIYLNLTKSLWFSYLIIPADNDYCLQNVH
ncbi:MAG: hypothetical protein ACK5MZ_08065, partial [Aestuariibaculum sp.]